MWICTPRRVENLARFDAADPWNRNQQARFDLDRVFMLEKQHRALPDYLISLWREGAIPVERLPALLKGLEPTLRRSAYVKLLSMTRLQRGIRRYAPSVLGVIVALLGLALAFYGPATGGAMLIAGALTAAPCAPQTTDAVAHGPAAGASSRRLLISARV